MNTEVTELHAELRRRREAALRSPPLPGGRRDPLDQLAGLPIGPAIDYSGALDVHALGLDCSHGDCPARKRGAA